MVEKDVEYALKDLILKSNDTDIITITNDFRSDGIIRCNDIPVGILEAKVKRNFASETTMTQVVCQAMAYYYRLVQKEKINFAKPFYLLVGDDNEIAVLNIHKLPTSWMLNKNWEDITPSKASGNKELFDLAESVIKLIKPVYYKFEDYNELTFGFHILFSAELN